MAVRFSRTAAYVHIKTILAIEGITVRWLTGRNWLAKAQAYESAWTVSIPKPNSRRQYLVGLHELGHLLGEVRPKHKLPISVGVSNVIEETSAWYWALSHIPPELDASIEVGTVQLLLAQTLNVHIWHAALLAGGQSVPE
jgi:hypothetical protein